MNEYNSAENEYLYDDDDEITLGELFAHLFDHFRLIVVITLIFSLIGVGYALMQSKEYEVSATVRISEPYGTSVIREYGGRYFTVSDELYELFSRENIEKAIKNTPTEKPDAEPTYEDINESLRYSSISGTYNYRIYVEKTSDTGYWTAFINNLVNNRVDTESERYLTDAETVKALIEDRIADYNELLSTPSSDGELKSTLDTITALKNSLRAVEVYINTLDSSFEWVTEPVVGTKNQGTSKALICIIFFLAGGVVGVITALCVGFGDKRVYSSKTLKKRGGGKLIFSIPLYKNADYIDRREFEYIAAKLNLEEDKTVALVSLSPKAGNLTIEKGLKGVTKAEIKNLGIAYDNPATLSRLKDYSYVLIVLRAGIDDSVHIEKITEDLESMGIKNYGFVLNAVDVSDRNVTRYIPKEKYTHHIWLLQSWKGYYRKNY